MVFECLTGARPFTAPALGPLIAKILGTPPPALSAAAPGAAIPVEVEAWMRRALAVEPDARFASARELSEAFMVASGVADSMDRGSSAGLPDGKPPSAVRPPAGVWETADTVALPSGDGRAPVAAALSPRSPLLQPPVAPWRRRRGRARSRPRALLRPRAASSGRSSCWRSRCSR